MPKTREAPRDSHGVDDYLEAIYELEEEGTRAVQARVADRLGVSRASVSEQVSRMVRMGLIKADGRTLRFTSHGYAIAEDAVRRHRMAERFLVDVLKMPWHTAHEEAQRFQGAISEEIERRIMRMMGGPATCPHGNPIPGTGAKMRKDLKPLNQFSAGRAVVLERMTEDVELDTKALRYFEEQGLVPGARFRITSRAPDGTLTLQVGRRRATLGPRLADNLWVRSPSASRRSEGNGTERRAASS